MDSAGVRMRKPCKHEIGSALLMCLKRNFRYFTDSLTNLIYAYDFDGGKLSNRRVVVDAIARGFPEKTFCDGLCIDEEGYIWSARFVPRLILEYILDKSWQMGRFSNRPVFTPGKYRCRDTLPYCSQRDSVLLWRWAINLSILAIHTHSVAQAPTKTNST